MQGIPIVLALLICLAITLAMGFAQGLLVAKLKMAPFVVTLCGMFIYRGLARFFMHDIPRDTAMALKA
jgi:ribose transport system permease protein